MKIFNIYISKNNIWILALIVSTAAAANSEPLGGVPLDLTKSENSAIWQARWMQDPLFRAKPFYNRLHKEKDKVKIQSATDDPSNIHTLFRRIFDLPAQPIQSAKLFITADDVYKLYINDKFIGLGPAPGYLFAYPYNGWDLTQELQSGKTNCLAIHVYYQGLLNRVWGSADNLQGLLAQLEIVFANGEKQILGTDRQWRCHRSEINSATRTIGYKTQFAEDLDLNKATPEWKSPAFDDSQWLRPFVAANPYPNQYTLTPQLTPPLTLEKIYPEKIIKTGEGRYFIDFGTELAGSPCFVVSGEKGRVVEIRCGEELSESNVVRFALRAGCVYQEFCTLSGRANESIEFFDYKGFRYVEVLNWPEELKSENIWAINRHYPFPEDACRFESSDELLNRIWRLCRNGVKQGTQDTYLDCPTREKGGYLGDAFVTGQSHLYLTGDVRIFKKALQDFANSARICPGLMAVAPGNFMQEIADYSLLWPVLLERYYLWSGDRDFIVAMIPILDGLLNYFAAYENRDGLLEKVQEKWNLVDWPQNLRDGYDYDRAADGVNTVLNQFYYGCLLSSARLYGIAGDDRKRDSIQAKMEQFKTNGQRLLIDSNTGLYVDAQGSTHSALHANALPLMYHLAPPEREKTIGDFLRQKRMQCGVYFAAFLLEGLYNAGMGDLAYNLITSKDIHSWNTMLEAGATTCMEAWGPEQKWNTSWLHPWSSCPIYLVAGYLMGLKPKTPGWETIEFSPQIPRNLRWAKLTIPTPKGAIAASFQQDENSIEYRLNIPDGGSVSVELPGVMPEITVDGTIYSCSAYRETAFSGFRELPIQIGSGEHVIQAIYQ